MKKNILIVIALIICLAGLGSASGIGSTFFPKDKSGHKAPPIVSYNGTDYVVVVLTSTAEGYLNVNLPNGVDLSSGIMITSDIYIFDAAGRTKDWTLFTSSAIATGAHLLPPVDLKSFSVLVEGDGFVNFTGNFISGSAFAKEGLAWTSDFNKVVPLPTLNITNLQSGTTVYFIGAGYE